MGIPRFAGFELVSARILVMSSADRPPAMASNDSARTRYAELHCVSNFSFLRGASHPAELVYEASNLGYTALALTDECSMAGIVRAHDAAKERNFKLIVGSEFRTNDDFHVVLLAPSQAAYGQICTLITQGRRNAPKGRYRLTRSQFEADLNECLALWIPGDDPTPSQAAWLKRHFPERCWIVVELHRTAEDQKKISTLSELSARTGIPLVASGDVHMHVRERRALQDTVTAIRHGCTIAEAGHKLFPNGERHLRTIEELESLYPRELLEESSRIAERCTFSLNTLKYQYPHELVPEGKDASEYLRELVEQGVRFRWPNGCPQRIRDMIEKELTLIRELRYEHFFLTVHDIVEHARKLGILCQGRGSAANSVVCYVLRITEVSPEQINTLFERFLSKERNEPPDIDVDFEHERREEIIQYVYEKYGRARAALAATVITYQTRSAVRDVGKALGLPLDIVNRMTKSHAYWDSWEVFQENLARQGLHIDSGIVQKLCLLVKELRHFPRHLSQHVGGFVISEESVSTLVPMENAAMPDRTIIQWDKNDLESLGLLKVDVLALGMLTAMRKTFELIAKTDGNPTRMDQIDDDDPATYAMIQAGDTIGVFQIESRAQMSMLPRLKPKNFYDLVIEVAIVRPGPIEGGMVHPYLQRRQMRPEEIPYPSEELKPILEKTLGVPIFQEQVMQIAVTAADFTPGEADALRRAMGAWHRNGKMHFYKERLLAGMKAKGYRDEFAEQIYKQIEGFGEYGFPESHSASFALLTYKSSWLKCHFPAAFFAGLINSQPMGFYQPAQLLEQAKRQGVNVLPVDVMASDWDCTLERSASPSPYAIRLGMRLVRGLKESEVRKIVAAREERQFHSVTDVSRRAQLSRRTMDLLAMSGALRSLTAHRNAALWTVLGIDLSKDLIAKAALKERAVRLPTPSEWEEVLRDYRQMRLTTGRHPLALLRPRLRMLGVCRRADLHRKKNGSIVRVSGLVTHLQHPQTARGVIFGSLEDETGINNIIIWPAIFDEFRDRILQANLMLVTGQLQSQDGVVHVIAQTIEDLTSWIREIPRNSRDFH
jgi:error-prone DNA polymerase